MRILLSGSTGFVGSAVLSYLSQKGHSVTCLTRGKGRDDSISWNPETGVVVKEDFEGFDAVIHLAGESIASRWTKERKRRILSSRIEGTSLLAKTLAQLARPPKVFLSASAIGFYGDRGEERLTEESKQGRGFLAQVCKEWERASEPVEERGVRRILTRFGVVVGSGGAVAAMIPAFKLGLGGLLGSGEQWMSWIALEDLVRAIDFCLENEEMRGPVNLVSPEPVRQREFARSLGGLIGRPTWFNQPSWLVRLLFGQMGEETLLSSAWVEPTKLLEAGFQFQRPSIQDALQKALEGLN